MTAKTKGSTAVSRRPGPLRGENDLEVNRLSAAPMEGDLGCGPAGHLGTAEACDVTGYRHYLGLRVLTAAICSVSWGDALR
jgi:hypothetical protein